VVAVPGGDDKLEEGTAPVVGDKLTRGDDDPANPFAPKIKNDK